MDIATTSNGALVPLTGAQISSKQKPKPKVLDEDIYLEKLENIIQRDFFPDISKLRAQNDYIDAVQRNDQAKIKQLQEKFSSRRTDEPLNTPRSPAFFETPSGNKEADDDKRDTFDYVEKSPTKTEPEKSQETTEAINVDKLCVDKFLYKYTSEDNASFQDIVEDQDKRLRIKHAWMYKAEAEHGTNIGQSLQLRAADEQLALPAPKTSSVDNWTYRAINSVMFVPDGVEWSPDEMIQRQKRNERTIVHENTRLPNVFEARASSSEAMTRAATIHAAASKGKVDAQGNEMTGFAPFGKYSLVVTPSPAPGVNESPFMTWGEIEGTPFRLDASDTIIPKTPGPSFKIPEEPLRDKLAHCMTAEIAKRYKDKKLAAIRGLKSFTPKFSSAKSTERLDSMSPAAKRLATSKLGIRLGTDKKLKASYTPSPARTPASKTPIVDSPRRKSPLLQTTSSERRIEALTDNLLNLPAEKPKASDFF